MKLLLDDIEIEEIPVKREETVKVIIPKPLGNNGERRTELDKTLLALDGNFSGLTVREVAKIHGVNHQSVGYLKNGYDRPQLEGRKEDKDLKLLINETKYKIADRATSKLMDSLDLFNPSALEQKDLPSAASKMAGIVEKVSQNFGGDGNNGTNVNFLIYAPRIRSEDSYEVIEVSE